MKKDDEKKRMELQLLIGIALDTLRELSPLIPLEKRKEMEWVLNAIDYFKESIKWE
jgi:hypothetical protein